VRSNTPTALLWLLQAILLFVLLVFAVLPAQRIPVPDFPQDYAAAWAILNGYHANDKTAILMSACCPDVPFKDAVMQTAHPPTATVVTLPFALLPWELARWLWLVVGWLSIAASWRMLHLPLLVCLATLPYWSLALALGTFEPLLFALLAIAIVHAQRTSVAGIALGTAIAVKIYPLLVVLTLFASRRWRIGVVAGITTISLMLIAELVTRATLGWIQYLPVNTMRWVDVTYNYSLVRVVRAIAPNASPMVCAALISLLFTLPLIARLKKGDIQLLMPVIFLANPLIWPHYFGLLATRPLGRVECICFLTSGMILWAVAMGLVQPEGLAPVAFGPMAVATLLLWYKDVKDI
jgi:hypothetical protein